MEWDEVKGEIEGTNASLLLGNGFSIGYNQKFEYERILDVCNGSLAAVDSDFFDYLRTANFEEVLRAYEDATWLMRRYLGIVASPDLKDAQNRIRQAFLNGFQAVHPEKANDIAAKERKAARSHLELFDSVFTLNYDLLLYWIRQARDGEKTLGEDGFGCTDGGPLTFQGPPPKDSKQFWNLHGGAHLFRNTQREVGKRKYLPGNTLIEQLRTGMEKGENPLVVLEGRPEGKRKAIEGNGYLSTAFDAFRTMEGTLVTFGVGFGSQDSHIADAIRENKGLARLFVGYHSPKDKSQCEGVFEEISDRVHYFDTTQGIDVWGRKEPPRKPPKGPRGQRSSRPSTIPPPS